MQSLTRTIVSYGVPIWHKVGTAPGGFTLDIIGLTPGTLLKAGTPLSMDESTRRAKPLVLATMYASAGASALTYQVNKGHNLIQANFAGAIIGGPAYAITNIDTGNALYDSITFEATLGAVDAGLPLFKSPARGATAASLGMIIKGLLYEDTVTIAGTDIAIVISGLVYARRIPAYPSVIEAAIPSLFFSQSL